jgi:hypothetical protein
LVIFVVIELFETHSISWGLLTTFATTKAYSFDMAADAVLLGLLPIIIDITGSTISEMGLLAMQRLLLAFLLTARVPAISPL